MLESAPSMEGSEQGREVQMEHLRLERVPSTEGGAQAKKSHGAEYLQELAPGVPTRKSRVAEHLLQERATVMASSSGPVSRTLERTASGGVRGGVP